MITSNVPSKREMYVSNGNTKFYLCNSVRILLKNKREYCGTILAIKSDALIMTYCSFDDKEIKFEDIEKIRLLGKGENLDNTSYFDDEEKEFWKTHIIDRNGIRERTKEEREV